MLLPGGSRNTCMIQDILPGLDLHPTDPALHLIMAGDVLDDLDRDLSVRLTECFDTIRYIEPFVSIRSIEKIDEIRCMANFPYDSPTLQRTASFEPVSLSSSTNRQFLYYWID